MCSIGLGYCNANFMASVVVEMGTAANIKVKGIVKAEGSVVRVEVDILDKHMVKGEDGRLSVNVIARTNSLEHCYLSQLALMRLNHSLL